MSKQGRVDRAVGRFMGIEDPSNGDERERAVFMESATFGMLLGIYASLAAAVVAAVLGSVLVPLALLVLMAVPAWGTIFYAGRHGLSVEELADRATRSRKTAVAATVFGGIALILLAMTYTVFTGHGLVGLPSVQLTGPDASGLGASLLRGGMVGGLVGALLGVLAIVVGSRRRRRQATGPAADEPDED